MIGSISWLSQKRSFAVAEKWRLVFFGILAALMCFSIYCRDFILLHHDVALYAEVSRNMIEGKGFTTDMRFPMELPYLKKVDGKLSRAYCSNIAHPIFLWIPLKLIGVNDYSILVFSSFFFILTLIPLYLIVRGYIGAEAGFSACLLYLFDPMNLRVGYMGYTQVPFVFLVMWGAYFLLREKSGLRTLVFSAALFALAGYFREESRLFLVAGIAYILLKYRNRKALLPATIFTAVHMVLMIPKLLYYYHHFGTITPPHIGFNLLNFLGSFDNWVVQNMLILPPVKDVVLADPLAFILRCLKLLSWALKNIILHHPFIISFAAIGAIRAFQGKGYRLFISFFLFLVVMQLALNSLVVPLERYSHMPAAYLIPVAAFGVVELVRIFLKKRYGIIALRILAVIIALAAVIWIAEPLVLDEHRIDNSTKRKVQLIIIERLSAAIPENSWVVTDSPVTIAWYARRPSLALLHSLDDFQKLDEYGILEPIYIYLSDWYYGRREIFDRRYLKAWQNETPLAGKTLLLSINLRMFKGRLFGPAPEV